MAARRAPKKTAPAKKAQSHIRTTQKERVSTDAELDKPSDIHLPESGPVVQEPEEIVALDKPLEKSNAEALAFNEQKLKIMLQPSGEENAPMVVDVYVNGKPKWIPVGVETDIERKYVEVLLRAKPISVSTSHDDIGAKTINNRLVRNTRAKYPLSILHDPSPKGGEWLNRLMAER